ncbi:VENN motif pre-toxin domain-containing protein [Rahnella perminowiae]|uniref:VENN motif pre-toxin domain-containing protein n=1 Tax=Rahnella perminowiae TaxID=2816244 RepID=UPI003654CD70
MILPIPTMAISSGNASGTTRSAVGNGTITVRDTSQQTQDVGTLSRNTDDANGHIDKIFDKDKIQTDQRVTQLAEQVMQQTASNVLNQLSVNAKDDAAKKLASDAAYQAADAGQRKSMEDAAFLAVDQKYGIGSPYWTAATAISGALAGLTGGDMSQALAGGLAPYLSLAVKAATTEAKGNVNEVENITGHALAGAVVAYLQGGSVSGGAAGAATGELAAQLIAKELYPGVKPENLTNDQKANASALSTLAAGLAGGVAGNSSVAAGTGGIAGKTAVENNSLSGDKARAAVKESAEEMKAQVREKMGENLASQLTNGVLNAVSETGDLALAGGDTVLDAAMALVSCATGDRYCDTAISDLGKKDQAAGNVLNSLVNGDAWAAIQNTAIKASQGDQAALENLAGILTGIVVPAKALPTGGKGGSVVEKVISPVNQKYVDILSPEAKQHILYGDSPTSGGHLYPGNPGKTTFPQSWSADKVVHEIGDIATAPNTQWYAQTGTGGMYTGKGDPAKWVAYEVRDGVRIRVVYQPATGKIITAFPDNAPMPSYKPVK